MQVRVEQLTERAARRAALLTRQQYNEQFLNRVMSYDIARLAAQDRGLDLCVNIDPPGPPDNVGAAILQMIAELRAHQYTKAL